MYFTTFLQMTGFNTSQASKGFIQTRTGIAARIHVFLFISTWLVWWSGSPKTKLKKKHKTKQLCSRAMMQSQLLQKCNPMSSCSGQTAYRPIKRNKVDQKSRWHSHTAAQTAQTSCNHYNAWFSLKRPETATAALQEPLHWLNEHLNWQSDIMASWSFLLMAEGHEWVPKSYLKQD